MSNSDLFQMKEEEDEKKIKSSDDNPDSCTDQPGAVDRKQDDHDSIKKKEFPQEDDCPEDQGIRLCKGPSHKIGTTQKRSVQTTLKEDDISSAAHKSRNDNDNDDDDNDDDDDDDGFTTPTSLDHKIPVMTTCPPAPKKNSKRRLISDSPEIYSPTLHVDFESVVDHEEEDLGGDIKRLRRT